MELFLVVFAMPTHEPISFVHRVPYFLAQIIADNAVDVAAALPYLLQHPLDCCVSHQGGVIRNQLIQNLYPSILPYVEKLESIEFSVLHQ